MTMVQERRLTRQEILVALRQRDGDKCQFSGEPHRLDFNITSDDDPGFVTIDHWMPQHFGKAEGWTPEEIWDLSNLKLMCKQHNAKKGDRIPNEDGTLPEKVVRKFRYRRDKRAERPDMCVACDNGHNLFADEICASCGCNAQRFPRSAKVRFDECDHEIMWCWVCSITPDMRPPAHVSAIRHAEVGETDGLYSE